MLFGLKSGLTSEKEKSDMSLSLPPKSIFGQPVVYLYFICIMVLIAVALTANNLNFVFDNIQRIIIIIFVAELIRTLIIFFVEKTFKWKMLLSSFVFLIFLYFYIYPKGTPLGTYLSGLFFTNFFDIKNIIVLLIVIFIFVFRVYPGLLTRLVIKSKQTVKKV